MPLPPYYLDILLGGGMTCITAMMMYGARILQVIFESLPKGPGGFPYVFIFAVEVIKLEPVYGHTWFTKNRSVGGMVYEPTSKVVAPSKTYWSPPRTKTPWSTKVYVHKDYLSKSCVRCSSHTSLSSICLHSGVKC